MKDSIHTIKQGDGGIYLITEKHQYWACLSDSIDLLIDDLGLASNVIIDIANPDNLANSVYKHI